MEIPAYLLEPDRNVSWNRKFRNRTFGRYCNRVDCENKPTEPVDNIELIVALEIRPNK